MESLMFVLRGLWGGWFQLVLFDFFLQRWHANNTCSRPNLLKPSIWALQWGSSYSRPPIPPLIVAARRFMCSHWLSSRRPGPQRAFCSLLPPGLKGELQPDSLQIPIASLFNSSGSSRPALSALSRIYQIGSKWQEISMMSISSRGKTGFENEDCG